MNFVMHHDSSVKTAAKQNEPLDIIYWIYLWIRFWYDMSFGRFLCCACDMLYKMADQPLMRHPRIGYYIKHGGGGVTRRNSACRHVNLSVYVPVCHHDLGALKSWHQTCASLTALLCTLIAGLRLPRNLSYPIRRLSAVQILRKQPYWF